MNAPPTSASPLCPTGVPGLDHVLCGGLPATGLYLVEGEPGAGKTTLALQFLLEGARRGEMGLYITLSETREELQQVAQSHGWSLDGVSIFDLSAADQQVRSESGHTFFHPSDVELNRLTQTLLQQIDQIKPRRVVLDSLSELRLLSETPLRFRRQVLSYKQHFATRQCTVLLLEENTTDALESQVRPLAHGVIAIAKSLPDYGATRRGVNVVKLRGVKFREGLHDAVLQTGGLMVFPRLVASEHLMTFPRESFASGIPELDALLGSGLDRGTSTIFMGPPGTGKSTLALNYAALAAARGERASLFIFDETLETLTARATALGIDIKPHARSGMMHLQVVDPAVISPGELTHQICHQVETEQTRMVIIDSINGYLNTVPDERYLNLQLHELLAYLNQQGVLTIMVLAQQGLMGNMQSIVDLTYLADTVVLFRYFEALGEVKQAISVIKKRSGRHERTIRELCIDEGGIRVGHPLTEFQGVLTGVPHYQGKPDAIMPSRRAPVGPH
jgi:circadian clock protein KaiC